MSKTKIAGVEFETDRPAGLRTPVDQRPLLFRPIKMRGITARNRIMLGPMSQYLAVDGNLTDWHIVHLGQFAIGGAGIVCSEETAVEARGRRTHHCAGMYTDAHVRGYRRVTNFLKDLGAVPAIQLGHAGRKASMQRPWHGNGPLDASDRARGEAAWPIVAPSPLPVDEGWLMPTALELEDLAALREDWRRAALRALEAGFEVVEIHGAHGYLLQSFLSPLGNRRNDAYGGDRAGRMRFPLAAAKAVRENWPQHKPMFIRVSAVDGAGGWDVEDTVVFAKALKELGVDVIDVSSGGLTGLSTALPVKRTLGFQVPFSAAVKREAGIPTMAVGLILDGPQAEAILQAGDADLIAIGRQALYDPFWALHAAQELGCDSDFELWNPEYGWWLDKRKNNLAGLKK
jgi:2,4-dienoyl-CoA reductase-like NADH-dependent reductase (Old Yellow Enzyme family)